MEPSSNNKPKFIAIAGIVALVVIAAVIALSKGGSKQTAAADPVDSSTSQQSASSTATSDNANSTSTAYKDGTYTETGTYTSPGGTESLKVTVTLAGGVVTDTSAVGSKRSDDSTFYAGQFIDNYKSLVVGKKISDIKLSKVSGSSLTPIGFNAALTKIKTDAQS
ncbi:MAG: uncharacterized protein JWM81_46 [Candidatus Saccharibacteria bacterium]|nr:uncharacterized protein [Candidatus Saccharibacteria bacterium]